VDQVEGEEWKIVVGVVGDIDVRFSDKQAVRFQLYEPWQVSANPVPPGSADARRYLPHVVIVRTASPAAVVPIIKAEVRRLDPAQPVEHVGLVTESLREPFARQQFARQLMIGVGTIGVVLATAAVFGVTARTVTTRTREIGLRMALGGSPMLVLRAVLTRACVALLTGLGLGVPVALGLSLTLKELLVGIPPVDLPSFAIAGVLVAGAGLVALWWPGRRAVRLAPAIAIRHES
jgi:ABC-type antimicrobial peptide transport system permease subunit